tara:strand:+ start:2023 stop:2340 length:318 start_codon:yes stop_codon:yes gene_type:complete
MKTLLTAVTVLSLSVLSASVAADGVLATNALPKAGGTMSGLSLTSALSSFTGNGIGVGVTHSANALEISVSGGMVFEDNGRAIMGLTHDQNSSHTMVTVGLGWSF